MKKISFLIILLLALSLFCQPALASQTVTNGSSAIYDDMDLIDTEELAMMEVYIAKIKETYDYNITLISAGYFDTYQDFTDYINNFANNNQQGSGISFIFGLMSDGTIEWNYWAYGEYSDAILPAILDYNIESVEYAFSYEDNAYISVYINFINSVETFLIQQTGIWIQTEPLPYTGEGGTIAGFDPIIDAADILTPAEEASLFANIEYFQKTYGFDITFLTMNPVPDYLDLLDYCDDYTLLDPTRDGLVFALNMDPSTRGYATSTRNFGEEAFTAAALDLIDDEVIPLLSSGDYFEAFSQYLVHTEQFIIAAQSGEPYSYPLTWQSVLLFLIAPSVVVAFFITIVIVNGIFVKQMKTAIKKTSAESFLVPGSLNLTAKEDTYLRTTETKTYSPRSSGSGGSSSGGRSSSRSGYGGSRGGRSGRF